MPDGARNLFLLAVKTKHIPGALGDVATRLGKAGVNILSTGDCSSPDNPESTLSFFVEAKDPNATGDDISKVLKSSPFFLDGEVKQGDSKLMIDDFGFPMMFFPGGRGILLPQAGMTAMFADLVKLFGTGGESILFRAGEAMGREGAGDLAKLFSGDEVTTGAAQFTKLYAALGWGRLQVIGAEPGRTWYTLRLSDGFESAGVKSARPNCHFTRGLIAGSSERILGRAVDCKEMECAAAGSSDCIFVVGPKEGASTSGSSGS